MDATPTSASDLPNCHEPVGGQRYRNRLNDAGVLGAVPNGLRRRGYDCIGVWSGVRGHESGCGRLVTQRDDADATLHPPPHPEQAQRHAATSRCGRAEPCADSPCVALGFGPWFLQARSYDAGLASHPRPPHHTAGLKDRQLHSGRTSSDCGWKNSAMRDMSLHWSCVRSHHPCRRNPDRNARADQALRQAGARARFADAVDPRRRHGPRRR